MVRFIVNKISDIKFGIKMKLQRMFRGYSDAEVWELGDATLYWMLPRLKKYREVMHGHPHNITNEQWENYIDDLIEVIELIKAQGDGTLPWFAGAVGPRYGLTKEEEAKQDRVLSLLGFWIRGIWD